MDRLTQHSKTSLFTDSDVIVEGQRLGQGAFVGLSYYRHYVTIINRLAELEDRFCNEPQTNADRIRAMTDEEMADFLIGVAQRGGVPCGEKLLRWLDWLKQEAE